MEIPLLLSHDGSDSLPLVAGKWSETRKIFEVKLTKSARNVEFIHSQIAKAASKAVLFGCKMLIAETIKRAFITLQALVEVTIRAKSSIEALSLILNHDLGGLPHF